MLSHLFLCIEFLVFRLASTRNYCLSNILLLCQIVTLSDTNELLPHRNGEYCSSDSNYVNNARTVSSSPNGIRKEEEDKVKREEDYRSMIFLLQSNSNSSNS